MYFGLYEIFIVNYFELKEGKHGYSKLKIVCGET